MEDFIYILIGVAWLVYSVYKSQNKAKAGKKQPVRDYDQETGDGQHSGSGHRQGRKPQAFEELLSEILGEEPKQVQVVPQPDYTPQDTMKRKSYDNYFETTRNPKKPESVEYNKRRASFVPSGIQEHFDDIEEQEYQIDFDIRKAVIYSEILKRPDY